MRAAIKLPSAVVLPTDESFFYRLSDIRAIEAAKLQLWHRDVLAGSGAYVEKWPAHGKYRSRTIC
jgi:hypothetical protein